MSDLTFPGTPVVVTGAAQGIGRDIAATFAGQGARVALVDRDSDALAGAVADLTDKDMPVIGVHEDVSSWEGAASALDKLIGQSRRRGCRLSQCRCEYRCRRNARRWSGAFR